MTDASPPAPARATDRPLTPRQRERRARILDATYSLLAAHGYEAVSMRLIARTAGVAERTLFNIYQTKHALIATSARERTDRILEEAGRLAPDRGIGFFLSLARTLALRTLDQPDVARVLAPVLVQHADMVGLNQVYRRHVGPALAELVAQDALDAGVTEVLTALLGMRMVGAVTLWAGRGIADDALETHMRLAVCQILLPHACGALQPWARQEARLCVDRLQRTAEADLT